MQHFNLLVFASLADPLAYDDSDKGKKASLSFNVFCECSAGTSLYQQAPCTSPASGSSSLWIRSALALAVCSLAASTTPRC